MLSFRKALLIPLFAFLICGACKATAKDGAKKGEPQLIEMVVTDKGFEPRNLEVHKGAPVTLVITRKTDATCATEIVIDEHGIHTALPLNRPVRITFTPQKSGQLRYGCAMKKMVGGVIKVL